MIEEVIQDGVLWLTLTRPDKHNAMTLAMREQLEALPERCADEPEIRCVVLTGAGPSFCAGADLNDLASAEGAVTPTNPAAGLAVLPIPSIAAVNGLCVTGGLEVALACDVIIAAESARFADTHAKMGVLPRWGMAARLPRRVGASRALEMSLTSRWVGSAEANLIGLADTVVADTSFSDHVRSTAMAFAAIDPTVAEAFTALYRSANSGSIDEALAAERAHWKG